MSGSFANLLESNDLALQIMGTTDAKLLAKNLLVEIRNAVDDARVDKLTSINRGLGTQDRKMRQATKYNQLRFGMKVWVCGV